MDFKRRHSDLSFNINSYKESFSLTWNICIRSWCNVASCRLLHEYPILWRTLWYVSIYQHVITQILISFSFLIAAGLYYSRLLGEPLCFIPKCRQQVFICGCKMHYIFPAIFLEQLVPISNNQYFNMLIFDVHLVCLQMLVYVRDQLIMITAHIANIF